MRITRTRRYALARSAIKALVPPGLQSRPAAPVDDAATVAQAEPVLLAWPADVPKPRVGLVRDTDRFPYWTKYRRFLAANDIAYDIYDIHRSSWLRDAKAFDMVVWRPMSFPHELEECRRKYSILERELGVLCAPSSADARLYEDKITQYELLKRHGLPVIDTFVSHDRQEALDHLAHCRYPLVWKVTAGSGSVGVELLRSRRTAERWVRRVFASTGRRTYWPYVGQKDYVYLQQLVPNAGYDVRVVIIGSTVFGYHRDVPRGEFRASGMNMVRWDPPCKESIDLARRVATIFDLPHVAVDMLLDDEGRHRIIEMSMFWRIDVLGEMLHDGVSGGYHVDEDGACTFRPMRVWPQELALKNVLQTRWIEQQRSLA